MMKTINFSLALFVGIISISSFANANSSKPYVFKSKEGEILLTNVTHNGFPTGEAFVKFYDEDKGESSGVIDWTNYLMPLERNCNHADIYISHQRDKEPLNKYLLKSVSDVKTQTDPVVEDFGFTEYTLKNATYRGYEIQKIKFSVQHHNANMIEVFFKNPNAYKVVSNFKFGNEDRMQKVGTKNLWYVKQNGKMYSIPYKQKPKDLGELFYLYNAKQAYETDINTGWSQVNTIDNQGELGTFGYFEFSRKTNSLSCVYGAEYD